VRGSRTCSEVARSDLSFEEEDLEEMPEWRGSSLIREANLERDWIWSSTRAEVLALGFGFVRGARGAPEDEVWVVVVVVVVEARSCRWRL